MSDEIAALFATLGLRVKESEWAKGDVALRKMQRQAESVAKKKAADEAHASRVIAQTQRAAQRDEERRIAEVTRSKEKAANEAKRVAAREAAERKQFIDRTVAQGQVATALIGGLGLYFGQRVVRAGIQFNSTMEDSKNEVAGMLALAHKSSLTTELKTADVLVENLRERASKLPGTTMEYIQMLSMITQPLTDAKLGLKDLEDMTVSSVVAAKGLHVPWMVAARDIDQAIRGQFHSVDPFSGKVLGSIGYKGEEGRSRYNQLTQEKRASEFRRALAQPQFAQLGEAAGQSFSGVLSTLEDAWQHFQGLVAKPLFEGLKEQIKGLNEWLEKNQKAVEDVAKSIGESLLTAFNGLLGVFKFLLEHGDAVTAILIGIGALMTAIAIKSIIALWPIYAIAAAVALVAYGVIKLVKHWDAVKDAARRAWEAIKDGFSSAFEYLANLPLIKQLLDIVRGVERIRKNGIVGEAKNAASKVGDLARPFFEGKAPLLQLGQQAPPTISAPSSAGAGGGVSVSVGKVDVAVNAPNADPGAVAAAVGKHFDEKMGNMLRETQDVVSP